MSAFSNAAHYAENTVRLVPGYQHLQQMANLLLAERVQDEGRVLVVGAGGGAELRVFAEAHPRWRFHGVDPSAEMLELAGHTLGPFGSRVELQQSYVDRAPPGPFDGATCLLTLHFSPKEERLSTLVEICKRLKPGAPLVVAHHSFPRDAEGRALWLNRYAAFAIASGVPAPDARNAIAAIDERLPILSPEEDEALLVDAGFSGVSLFYAGFTFRGWVGYRT